MYRKKERKIIMRTIKCTVETGFANAIHEFEVEVEDNATDSEIDEIVWEEACNYISIGWAE